MGGFGSGRFGKRSDRPTTADAMVLTLYDCLPGRRRRVFGLWIWEATGNSVAFNRPPGPPPGVITLAECGDSGEGEFCIRCTNGLGGSVIQHVALSASFVGSTQARRWWMHCPECARRCAKLYRLNGVAGERFACRTCRKLVYPTQRMNDADRMLRRAEVWYARVGCSGEEAFYPRPKRMHITTFNERLDRADTLFAASVIWSVEQLTRNFATR
jgi:hypothetical protein